MKTHKLLKAGVALACGLMMASAASAQTKIQWWHAMTGALSGKIDEMVADFNKSQSDYEIVAINKGSYVELMTSAIAAYRAGGQPHILQIYEVGTATFMAAGDAVYPAYQLMEDAGKPFNPSDYLAAITGYYTTPDGKMLSFPFNSSTVTLYYNKDVFEKAGLDPNKAPATWEEVEDFSRKIVTSGAARCGFSTSWPSWVNVENFSAWHNVPIGTKENGFGGTDTEFTIDNPVVKRHWNNLVKWQQENGLYTYGGREDSGLSSFLTGNCAIALASSASLSDVVESANFAYGIGMQPYYSDVEGAPQNSIIGGASLWVMRGHDDGDYKGVAEFFEYLSRPEVQADWAKFSGYLPITNAAYDLIKQSGYYEEEPGSDSGIREITLNPPTENSKGLRFGNFAQIRLMFEEELEQAINGTKSVDQALADAQARGNAELRNFEATQARQ